MKHVNQFFQLHRGLVFTRSGYVAACTVAACAVATCAIVACTPVQEQFQNAAKTGRTADLKSFLKENPNSPYTEKTQLMISNIALNKARIENTEEAYQKIINDNPGNNHLYRLASSKIESLNYAKAHDADTVEAYKAFILRFPFGKSKAAAQSRIESIMFQQVKKENNEDSLRKYLKTAKHNTGDIKQARQSLEKLAFEKAVKSNTISAYQAFIAKYENSVFVIKATERLLNLQLPSTVYLSDKGHVSIQVGKITSISDNKLIASYGNTAKQEFALSKNTLVCSKSKKTVPSTKLESDQDISIATIPAQNDNSVVAIYIGNTTVAVNRDDNSSNQPTFVDFPDCFPPLTKR